ncbi:MAG: hypothetical protein EBX51_08145 [Acidimicrobiia bacterium]|nr:hypothetical protein [Acidimicrobiia bacterium]
MHLLQCAFERLRHAVNLRRDTLSAMRRNGLRHGAAAAVLVATMLFGCSADDVTDMKAAVTCPPADTADVTGGITQERADLLIGFREADAQRCAEDLGWAFRVGRRDAEYFALTMDYSAQRVTVEIDDDVVTMIGVG